jgi:hypothetical protein
MKELQITSSRIVVSANSLNEKGYIAHHELRGILPGCRKVAILFFSPSTGSIWVKNLYSHNGEAHIDPAQWAELVKSSPVVPDKIFPYALTPEIIEAAYADALSTTTCSTVTSKEHVHKDYQPKFDPMVRLSAAQLQALYPTMKKSKS